MSNATTTKLSTKGQVVIPEEIRTRLGLKPGTRFVVIADQGALILKVLEPPSAGEFRDLLKQARKVARETGLTVGDVEKAVARVRRAK